MIAERMELENINFLYSPDLIKYVEILKIYENHITELLKTVNDMIKKEAIQTLQKYINDTFLKHIHDIIGELQDRYNIYDLIEEDYLNNGYIEFLNVITDAINYNNSVIDECNKKNNIQIKQAEENALKQVHGLDYNILTSSIVSYLVYDTMNKNEIRRQVAKAQEQYHSQSTHIIKANEFTAKRIISNHMENTVKPKLAEAITHFYLNLFEQYISNLSDINVFDKHCLEKIDLKRSTSLLKNIENSSHKELVIFKSLELCPFNINTYIKAYDEKIFDEGICDMCKRFLRADQIVSYIQEKHSQEIKDKSLKERIENSVYYYKCLSLLTDVSEISLKQKDYQTDFQQQQVAFEKFYEGILDEDAFQKYTNEYGGQYTVNRNIGISIWKDEQIHSFFFELYDESPYKKVLSNIKYRKEYGTELTCKNVSTFLINQYDRLFDNIREEELQKRLKKEKLEKLEEEKRHITRKKRNRILFPVCIVSCIGMVYGIPICQNYIKYNKAVQLEESGDNSSAAKSFYELGSFKDSEERATYNKAELLMSKNYYSSAERMFDSLGDYKDSSKKSQNAKELYKNECYDKANKLFEEGNYQEASDIFSSLGEYKDSSDKLNIINDDKMIIAQAESNELNASKEAKTVKKAFTGLYSVFNAPVSSDGTTIKISEEVNDNLNNTAILKIHGSTEIYANDSDVTSIKWQCRTKMTRKIFAKFLYNLQDYFGYGYQKCMLPEVYNDDYCFKWYDINFKKGGTACYYTEGYICIVWYTDEEEKSSFENNFATAYRT